MEATLCRSALESPTPGNPCSFFAASRGHLALNDQARVLEHPRLVLLRFEWNADASPNTWVRRPPGKRQPVRHRSPSWPDKDATKVVAKWKNGCPKFSV